MSASLDTMPAETHLTIFRLLVPDDPDNPDREDLGNLRLTCKALRACATEVYFEHYYMLIRKEGNVYVQPRSYQLLQLRPDFATLVKTVWVAHAAATSNWLRLRSAFGAQHLIPTEDKALQLAYMSTEMYKTPEGTAWKSSDDIIDSCRKTADFSPAEYEKLREYYRLYIAPSACSHAYGLPDSTIVLKDLLIERLRILPNLNHLRIARPQIVHTTFYKERYDFWAKNGLENRAIEFHTLRPSSGSTDRFPWDPSIIAAGLETLPSTCKTLELDIFMFYPLSEDQSGIQHVLNDASVAPTRIDHLSLVVAADPDYCDDPLGALTRFTWKSIIRQYSNLSRLSISCKTYSIAAEHKLFEPVEPGSREMEMILRDISLPNLRQLSIKSWDLQPFCLLSLEDRFPCLRILKVANIALGPGPIKSDKPPQALWHMLAKNVKEGFGGQCALIFEDGPFIEYRGYFLDECNNYSHEDNPAVMGVLKPSAMAILTAISQATVAKDDLSNRYLELTEHDCPDVWLDWGEAEERCENGECGPHCTTVETPGMTYMYYEVVQDMPD